MRPTDELCKRLDELGVKYDAASYANAVFWGDAEYELNGGHTRLIVGGATPEQAVNATVGPKITEDTSNGWHTLKELFHHRALLFSVIVHDHRDMCWKSKTHDNGIMYDGMFIVGIDTPWGQASFHYGMEYWDMFDCKVLERAPKYDGYTPEESVSRIARLVELDREGDRL